MLKKSFRRNYFLLWKDFGISGIKITLETRNDFEYIFKKAIDCITNKVSSLIDPLTHLNPFSTNVPFMDKPVSWFLPAKSLKNTCGSVALELPGFYISGTGSKMG